MKATDSTLLKSGNFRAKDWHGIRILSLASVWLWAVCYLFQKWPGASLSYITAEWRSVLRDWIAQLCISLLCPFLTAGWEWPAAYTSMFVIQGLFYLHFPARLFLVASALCFGMKQWSYNSSQRAGISRSVMAWPLFALQPVLVFYTDVPVAEKVRPRIIAGQFLETVMWSLTLLCIMDGGFVPIIDDLRFLTARMPSNQEKLQAIPIFISRLLPPFIPLVVAGFFLIWDAWLPFVAQLTRWPSQEFYLDWWTSTTWAEFMRRWNLPVHEWLWWHVYLPLKRRNYSTNGALGITVTLSGLAHELFMYAIFGRFSGYFFIFMLFQLPVEAFNSYFKLPSGWKTASMWISITFGLATITTCSLLF